MIELVVFIVLCLLLVITVFSFFLLSSLLSVAVFFRLFNLLVLGVLAAVFSKKYLFPWAYRGITEKRNLHMKYKIDKKNLQIEHDIILDTITKQAAYARELVAKIELWRMHVRQEYEERDGEKKLSAIWVQDQSRKRGVCLMVESMRSCVVPSAVFYARQKLIQKIFR